jgi:putative membrane protein
MEIPDEHLRASTVLAIERTFSAWLRTGLAAELGGLAISRLLIPGWLPRIIGTIFILVGMAIYIIALLSYRKTLKEIQTRERRIVMFRFHHINLLTGALMLSAILSLFLSFE